MDKWKVCRDNMLAILFFCVIHVGNYVECVDNSKKDVQKSYSCIRFRIIKSFLKSYEKIDIYRK